jgi:outer membrane protein assembly factor BamB
MAIDGAETTRGGGDDVDWEYLGICSSTLIDGDFGYVVTNRCEIACLDLKGLADGNAGFSEEGKYMAGPGNDVLVPGPTDADIVWVYDMRKGVGVAPHNIASSSVALGNGVVFASTSNGVDGEHDKTPAAEAPCLVALDAKSGKLLARESAGISERMFHCNWSSPCLGEVDGMKVVFFGGGDGFLYAFNQVPTKTKEGTVVFPELWRYDANAKEYRTDEKGENRDYRSFKGRKGVRYDRAGSRERRWSRHAELCRSPDRQGGLDLQGDQPLTFHAVGRQGAGVCL